MLDRTQAPLSADIAYQPIKEVEQFTIGEELPVFIIRAPEVDVVKAEFKLKCGTWYESNLSESWFTAKMLMEGSKDRSGKEIKEAFERLGAFVDIEPGFDDVSISVYGLQRNFTSVIELIWEVLSQPMYPESDLELMKQVRKQELKLNNSKNNMLASKKIREAVFGLAHPYGKALTDENINEISADMLFHYHQNKFWHSPQIFISGKVDDQLLHELSKNFKPSRVDGIDLSVPDTNPSKEIFIDRSDSLQSSIRMAWPIVNPSHDDYFSYLISNNVLGGYFGSRLMKNIREDKGYTYGISAYPLHLANASFGLISTDVMAEHTQATIDEIWKEIDLLKAGEIDEEEIVMVTNYLSGKFESSIGTPFQLMGKFKSLHKFGLGYNHYEKYFEALKSFSTTQLQDSIGKYFNQKQAHLL